MADPWALFSGEDPDEDGDGADEAAVVGLRVAYSRAWELFLRFEFSRAKNVARVWLPKLPRGGGMTPDEVLIYEADLSYITGACSRNAPELLHRALQCYEEHLALVPENANARRMRAETLLRLRRYDDALEAWEDVAWRRFSSLKDAFAIGEEEVQVAPFQLRHLADQLDFVAAGADRDLTAPHDAEGRSKLRAVAEELEGDAMAAELFFDDAVSKLLKRTSLRRLPPELRQQVEDAMLQIPKVESTVDVRLPQLRARWPVAPAGGVSASVLNPMLEWSRILAEYQEKGIVVIEDLLAPPVLQELQRYAREAPIFHTMRNGFLGAFPADGFTHPLVSLIARAVEQSLGHANFEDAPLGLFWLFKYTRSNPRGIGLHADPAKVNLNLWLTPDDAHVSGGGLLVYSHIPDRGRVHEANHEFSSVEEEAALERTLAERGVVHVPYRCNRATLFVSDRYHRSEDFEFVDGYENHRVNLTFLWGDRLGAQSEGAAKEGTEAPQRGATPQEDRSCSTEPRAAAGARAAAAKAAAAHAADTGVERLQSQKTHFPK